MERADTQQQIRRDKHASAATSMLRVQHGPHRTENSVRGRPIRFPKFALPGIPSRRAEGAPHRRGSKAGAKKSKKPAAMVRIRDLPDVFRARGMACTLAARNQPEAAKTSPCSACADSGCAPVPPPTPVSLNVGAHPDAARVLVIAPLHCRPGNAVSHALVHPVLTPGVIERLAVEVLGR